MGVRGLQTFLEKYCPSACRIVHVSELIKKYKNETGKDAVIVLDTESFYWAWYKGMDWVIGYEIQEFLHRLRTFVESFEKLGVKLVFFVGGVNVEKKRQTWRNRKARNLQDTLELCDFLEKGLHTKYIPEKYAALPASIDVIASMLLKHVLKCEVHMTIEECNEEIIAYVHENECMAIFTQDSDFIVSEVNKCKVLSSKKFNPRNMTTLQYDREALASLLNIRTDQLPFLGILGGNDYIDYETVRVVHRSLCGVQGSRNVPYHIMMPAIGRYIRTLSNQPIDKILETICYKIFGSKSSLDVVKCLYNSYLWQKKRDDLEIINLPTKWSDILNVARDRHRNVVVPAYIWGILNDRVFEQGVTLEDLRKSSSQQMLSITVTRTLRQRIYGVLLKEYEHLTNNTDVQIEEWCAEDALSYEKPVFVKPIAPTVEHPGLLRLWSDDKSNELGEMKWRLFLSCVSSRLISIDDWRLLTADLVAISATLFYLIEQKFIDEDECNAIIATVATYSLYSREKLIDLDYVVHNPRCTHISICVIRTFAFVLIAMAACGYPVPLSGELVYLKFEAKLSQIKFKEMKKKKSIEEMCEKNDKCIELFDQMKKVINPVFRKGSVVEPKGKSSEKRADDGDTKTEGENIAVKLAQMKVL